MGSSASIAWPNTVLNTIVAESLDYVATELEKGRRRQAHARPGCSRRVIAVLKQLIKQHKRVHLRRRQLLRGVARRGGAPRAAEPEGLGGGVPTCCGPGRTSDLFRKYGVLNKAEYESRIHIAVEKYVKQLAHRGGDDGLDGQGARSCRRRSSISGAWRRRSPRPRRPGWMPGDSAQALKEFVGLVTQFRRHGPRRSSGSRPTTRPTRCGTPPDHPGAQAGDGRAAGDGRRAGEPGRGRICGRCRRIGICCS